MLHLSSASLDQRPAGPFLWAGRFFLYSIGVLLVYMENHTAKHFALQLGSLACLYLSLSFLLVLLFGLINLRFPDPIEGYWALESAASGVRFGIAMVLVFFPTYLILTRIVNRNRRESKDQSYLGLTKWLIYLSILVGGMTLLGDLVAIILAFLEGEITERFIYKALSVLVVVGSAFYYYVLDARGYWLQNERLSIIFALIASVIVLLAVGFGFMNIEAPSEVREQRLDDKQITDLQDMQWRVVSYYEREQMLPETLEAVYEAGMVVPTAPENRPNYRYLRTEQGFSLCATFTHTTPQDQFARPYFEEDKATNFRGLDNWEHGSGDVCFERTMNN